MNLCAMNTKMQDTASSSMKAITTEQQNYFARVLYSISLSSYFVSRLGFWGFNASAICFYSPADIPPSISAIFPSDASSPYESYCFNLPRAEEGGGSEGAEGMLRLICEEMAWSY